MTIGLPEIEVRAVCHDCRLDHTYRVAREDLSQAMADWLQKHFHHAVEFGKPTPIYENRWKRWLHEFWNDCPIWAPTGYRLGHGYGHNADVKGAYVASADYTITLASLATSSTRLVGRESTAVSNASNKYLDYLISGKITAGTTPTADKGIDVIVYGAIKDTPAYPDPVTGSDAAITLVNAYTKASGFRLAATIGFTAGSNVNYPLAPFSLTALFGALVPPTHHGLIVSHDGVAALNATGGNHVLSFTGAYGTVA